jgi:hypothetical protein
VVAVGREVNIATAHSESAGGGPSEVVDEEALCVDGDGAVVLGHEADGRPLEGPVGDRAIEAAEIAADVVDPGLVLALHGGEADAEFVFQDDAIEIEFAAIKFVTASDEGPR